MPVNELSFDPQHDWYPVPGIAGAQWSIEVFTATDVRLVDPARARFDGARLQADGLMLPGGQATLPGSVSAKLAIEGQGVTWQIVAQAEQAIKAVKVLFRGLPGGDEGGWWSPTTPRDTSLTPAPGQPVLLRYPWPSWQTPWACAGEGPGVTVSVRDSLVRAKRFYAFTPPWSPGPVAEVICDQLATQRGPRFEVPEVRLQQCAGAQDIAADLRAHLGHLESAFGLVPWQERSDVPPWARRLRLVVTLHGQHWTGYVFNTFDKMAAILREVTRHIPGDEVIAYLPGWEGRYYWQYPVYRPGADLGGEPGFGRLAETARALGVHLMPMFGAHGANVHQYPAWQDAVFRSPGDRYAVHVNHPDWDGDRTGEDDQIFLNPGEPGYRAFLGEQISDLVARYQLDAAFLDTSGCWFDDPRHDLVGGYRALVGDLTAAHPRLLVCGEGWFDALLGLFPMNQTWLDVSRTTRTDDLPYRYTRLLGHLADGCPGDGSSGVQEAGFRAVAKPLHIPGYLPSLGFVSDTLERHQDEIATFCKAMNETPGGAAGSPVDPSAHLGRS